MKYQPPAGNTLEVVTVTLNPAIDQTVTIPGFAAGQVNRVEQAAQHAGGKGVNVASVLADYGHAVAVTGFLGSDNAELFESLFSGKKIQDSFVRIAGKTRLGIKIMDPLQQQTTDINFPGQTPTPADLFTLLRRLAARNGEWVVLAGSLPPGMESALYRDLTLALKSQKCRVILDTSGDALHHAVAAAPHVIKPNIHELEILVGRPLGTPDAIVDAAQALLQRGIQMVVVSQGKDGACFVTKNSVVTARPPATIAKSTVGAGDAMVAGIVAAQLRGLSLPECARLATAFSLDAITHLGSGLTSAAVIEDLMALVTVEEYRQ